METLFADRLWEDLEAFCRPRGLPLLHREGRHPSSAALEMISNPSGTCRVTLHTTTPAPADAEQTQRLEADLLRILSSPPYTVLSQTPDEIYGNSFVVGEADA